VQHLWAAWQGIEERIRGAGHLMLFSDFDGTLCPVVARPELAGLPGDTERWLRVLAGNPRVDVAIISGRALPDLRARVGIEGLTYAGNHGLEIRGPAVTFVHPVAEETKPVMGRLYRDLSRALEPFTGVIMEDKGLTLSIHYRLLDQAKVGQFKDVFNGFMEKAGLAGGILVTAGKMVYEIRPAVEWNKGQALRMLVEAGAKPSRPDPLTMFLGDDWTDEDGFKAIRRTGGVSIFVGERVDDRSAKYFVKSPGEVAVLLEKLCRAVGAV
jgi:trehalose 6-phosphate phosphatase